MTAISLGMPGLARVTPDTTGRPETDLLVDRYGRVARDLRISLTEKCSLRCTYCMPAEGLPPIDRDDLLTPTEVARLVGIGAHDLGIREVRFTGGEPLMRADLEEIVRLSAKVAPQVNLSITTNAVGLKHRAAGLKAAGLHRLNISLDTVDRAEFAALTRRDRLDDVLAGIAEARRVGFSPVKVNAVLLPETLNGAIDLVEWALRENITLRFIEEMPLDADERWSREEMVDAAALLKRLSTRFTLEPVGRDDPSAPAELFGVNGTDQTIGIIASVTRSFCGDCDRTRITAEGTVRSCLFGDNETDLRTALRSSADDREIADLWRAAMWAKPLAHGTDETTDSPIRPARSMGAIGG